MIRSRLYPALLFGVSCLVFFNAVNHPFVHDDIVFIAQNPDIGRLDKAGEAFAAPASGIAAANTYYRPLLEVVYRLEYRLFGLQPAGWHAVNVLLHALNGLLAYRLLLLLGFGAGSACAAALLFLVHPVQVESVAAVAGISNLLMACFVLSALILYLKDRYILSLLIFGAALLAKEQAVMAVPLLLLLDWYRGRTGKKQMVLWGAFALFAVGFMAARQALTGSSVLAAIMASPGELKLRLLAVPQTLAMYVRLIFAPYDLHYYRSTDILIASMWWGVPVGIAAGMLIRASRAVRFGAVWFFLALLPVLNIVPLINEYSLILTAEHFLYLPLLGIAVLIVVFGEKIFKAKAPIVCAVALLVCAALSLRQNTFWRNETVLFERMTAFEEHFGRGHLLLAKAYYFDKRYKDAEEHFGKAYAIMAGYQTKAAGYAPRRFYAGFRKGILFDWAHTLEDQGRLPQAKQKYLEALSIDPRDPILWNNLGALCVKMNALDEARTYFQKALDASPGFGPAMENLRQLKG